MTKKNKTILGVVGGVLVVGGIGAATGAGKDENNSYPYINSSVMESSVTSVQSTDNSLVLSSSEYISSSIVESSVTSVQSADNTSFFSSSVYISSSIVESSVTSVQSTYSSSTSSSSAVEHVSSVSPVESSQSSIPSTPNTTTSSTSPTVPSTPQYNSGVVYIAASGNGTKYHKSPNCSNMNGNVISMTRDEALAKGYGPCKKKNCYG